MFEFQLYQPITINSLTASQYEHFIDNVKLKILNKLNHLKPTINVEHINGFYEVNVSINDSTINLAKVNKGFSITEIYEIVETNLNKITQNEIDKESN